MPADVEEILTFICEVRMVHSLNLPQLEWVRRSLQNALMPGAQLDELRWLEFELMTNGLR
ncbi:hypothetical protein [Coleofasciculus sp. G2-EDA-02]|uniref:hypothetical protein n=1 Tax=Coleofasciculus sp. G2-EDA-02 TaxID=3069529 RepID=UPI0033023279